MTAGEWAAVVAAAAAVIGLALLVAQAYMARRTFQGQTLLALLHQLQEPDVRQARSCLYEWVETDHCGPEQLFERRAGFESALHTIDLVAVLLGEKMLPRKPLMRAWGGMIARCWVDGEAYVRWRRLTLDHRPDLWKAFERLGEEAIRLERAKRAVSGMPPWLQALEVRRAAVADHPPPRNRTA